MRLAFLVLCLIPASVHAQVGTLDTDFGDGGIVVTDLEGYDDFYALASLPDSTIAVVGRSSTSVNVPQNQSARYLRYDGDGAVLTERRYNNGVFGCSVPEAFYDLVVEPDGTILAGGFAQFDCGGPARDFWVHRLDPDGTSQVFARPSFFGVFENTWALVRHPDGRITAGGIASPDVTIATRDAAFTRYTPGGEIDVTFGTAGETTVDVLGDYDFLYDLIAMPDGGVLAAGFAYDGSQYDMLFVRLDGDGLPDAGFGTDGIVTLDFNGGDDFAYKLARQPDGQIVVAGQRVDGGIARATLLRLSPDGTLDPTFGTGGVVTVDVNGLAAFVNGLVLQTDGKIVVSGSAETAPGGVRDILIARLLSDGTLDPSFGTDGMQTASWSDVDDIARSLAIMPDGDLVVLGYTREDVGSERVQDLALARFVGDTPPPVSTEEAPVHALAVAVTPNPVRRTAQVRFELAEAGPVELAVTDLLGRQVASVIQGEVRPTGAHVVPLDASSWAPGLYVVWLVAGNELATQRLTVVR